MWINLEAWNQNTWKLLSKVFDLEILFHATNELIINWNGFVVIFLSGDSQFGINILRRERKAIKHNHFLNYLGIAHFNPSILYFVP